MHAPLLRVLAGPNGAGKSTYYARRIAPFAELPFINADVIARVRWPQAPEAHSYEAAQIAEDLRKTALRKRQSFVAETVFSHPSKLDLLREARAAGYQVWLTYIGLESALVSADRVEHRVARGGHNVPLDKIMQRYERVTALMREAVRLSDRAWVLDNSSARKPYRLVMLWERGELLIKYKPLPKWAKILL